MAKPPFFFLFFALFWTAIVGTFDLFVGRDVIHAVRSGGFQTTTGTVISSEVTEHSGDEGPTYRAEIRYSYRVFGDEMTSDRYSFAAFPPSGSRWARERVAAYPVGRSVTVYYDADDPELSALKPGIEGSTLFMLLFLTPFNVVMIGLWWFVGPQFWHWWNGTQPPPAPWFRDGGALRVRLPYLPPLGSALGTAGFCAFVGIFVIGFSTGFEPSVDTMLGTWLVVLGLSVAAGVNVWLKEREGAFDLVIRDRSVELPAIYGRVERRTLDRSAISGVAIEKTEYEDSEKSTTYEVRFQRRGGGHETLVTWHDGQSAERLAVWLREKLGLR
jgi:hypothetical protein